MEDFTSNSDTKRKRLAPEEFEKMAAGGTKGLIKNRLKNILFDTEDAISTGELTDMLKLEGMDVRNTDDVLPLLMQMKKDGICDNAKSGITYFWRAKR